MTYAIFILNIWTDEGLHCLPIILQLLDMSKGSKIGMLQFCKINKY